MILVRFESEEIRSQALALWLEAFGGEADYVDFFLDTHEACVCLTEQENGKLCSALYLLDGKLCGKPAYYLYAAATFKEYRGKGCMSRLLGKAEEYALKKGRAYIVLVPAEESLFDFYSRFGYKTCFYAKKQNMNEDFFIDKNKCFVWHKAHLQYIRSENIIFESKLFRSNGMLFTVYGEDEIKVPVKDADEKYRYAMTLSLDDDISQENFYIGLTLDD